MPTILGVDQALGPDPCAFALVDEGGIIDTCLEKYAGIPTGEDRLRCVRFGAVLQQFFLDYRIDYVVTELVRTYSNGMINALPIMKLSMLQGVMNILVPHGVPIFRVNTSSWQAMVLHPPSVKRGEKRKKNALKLLSVEHVQGKYGETYSEHLADAINLCEFIQLVKFQERKNVVEIT